MTRKPDLFLVGMPKSGTTAMSDYLGIHPDIFMARKEMHHFGSDLKFGPNFYRRSADAYRHEFSGWQQQSRGGEASVWYLFSQTAARELKTFNPAAQIIIMLREPVELLYSMYSTFVWDGNEHLPTFEAALAAQDERKAGRLTGRQTYFAQGLVYREIVRYAEQVERYFNVFGRDRVQVIFYDEFSRNTASVYRDCLKFLDVDHTYIPARFKPVNVNKQVRSPLLRSLFQDNFVRSSLLKVRPWLPRKTFAWMQRMDARVRHLNSRHVRRETMDPELRQQLRSEFAPEVRRLELLLGCDLSHWQHDPAPERTPAAKPVLSPQVTVQAALYRKRTQNLG